MKVRKAWPGVHAIGFKWIEGVFLEIYLWRWVWVFDLKGGE